MYSNKELALQEYGSPVADDLTGAAVHGNSKLALSSVIVRRIMAVVTTAVVSSGDVVIAFKRRPTPGSATGESTMGSLNIPNGAAVGKVYYKDISPVDLDVGDEIAYEVTTAAAGGGAAGGAMYSVECDYDPEVPANESDMVLSS